MELRFRHTECTYHHRESGGQLHEDVRHQDKPPLTGGDGPTPGLGPTPAAG